MEQPNTQIKFYVRRSFSEKMNASFDFIKQNWKPLLKYSTYLILPLCLIQTFFLNKLTDSSMLGSELSDAIGEQLGGELSASFVLNYVGLILFAFIASMLMTSVAYALIQLYNENEESLQSITFDKLKPQLFRNLGRSLVIILFTMAVTLIYMVVVVFLAVVSLHTLWITVPLTLVLFVPLAYLVPVYLFEKIKIGGAFIKSFRLGFPTWGGIVGMSIVMGIIASIFSGVLAIPWYVVTMVKYIFGMSDAGSEITISGGYNILLYVLGAISIYGGYISSIFMSVGLSYQYAHANEKVNSVSVVDDIDNFEQL